MRGMLVAGVLVAATGCAGRPEVGSEAPGVTPAEARAIETHGVADPEPAAPLLAGGAMRPSTHDVRGGDAAESAASGWDLIGRSVEGRPLEAVTVQGERSDRVLVIGSIHGTEREGLAVIDKLVDDLRARPVAASVRVIRDMNPDGSAARTRGNSRGVDLNRNWPAGSFVAGAERGERPLSEPEALAVWRDIERWQPTLVVVLHSTASGPYVNYDGPAVEAATRFAGAAWEHDPRWRVVADMGYPTPGSLGSMMGDDRRVPILTIEFDRGQGEASVWAALRDGVRAVCGGESPGRARARATLSHHGLSLSSPPRVLAHGRWSMTSWTLPAART